MSECPVCFCEYADAVTGKNHPVILTACGHSICGECAAKMARGSNATMCPLCATRTPVGSASLPCNFSLMAVISSRLRDQARQPASDAPVPRSAPINDEEQHALDTIAQLYEEIEHGSIHSRQASIRSWLDGEKVAHESAIRRMEKATDQTHARRTPYNELEEHRRVLGISLARHTAAIAQVNDAMDRVQTLLRAADERRQKVFVLSGQTPEQIAQTVEAVRELHANIVRALDAVPSVPRLCVYKGHSGTPDVMCIVVLRDKNAVPIRVAYPDGHVGIDVAPDDNTRDIATKFLRAVGDPVTNPVYCSIGRAAATADSNAHGDRARSFREWELVQPQYYMGGDEITVISLTGSRRELRVVPEHVSIQYLKWLVYHVFDVKPVDQRIIYAGRQLEPMDRSVASMGISGGCTIHMVQKLRGGKPVILFYPPAGTTEPIRGVTTEVAVNTSVGNALLTTLHPRPQIASPLRVVWSDVTVHPDGSVETPAGDKAAYLFWECDVNHTHPALGMSVLQNNSCTFCVPSNDVGGFLDAQLAVLGLTIRERTDMITFWLADMQKNEYVLLRFIPCDDVDKSIALRAITGAAGIPVVVSRIYFAFRSITAAEAGKKPNCSRGLRSSVPGVRPVVRDPTKLTMVEWGAIHVK